MFRFQRFSFNLIVNFCWSHKWTKISDTIELIWLHEEDEKKLHILWFISTCRSIADKFCVRKEERKKNTGRKQPQLLQFGNTKIDEH